MHLSLTTSSGLGLCLAAVPPYMQRRMQLVVFWASYPKAIPKKNKGKKSLRLCIAGPQGRTSLLNLDKTNTCGYFEAFPRIFMDYSNFPEASQFLKLRICSFIMISRNRALWPYATFGSASLFPSAQYGWHDSLRAEPIFPVFLFLIGRL